ncbi:MAG: hypothetical protein WDN04_24050 [Rhodospirillales bacterium]
MNAPDPVYPLDALIGQHANRLDAQVIQWRRHIHANPELETANSRPQNWWRRI